MRDRKTQSKTKCIAQGLRENKGLSLGLTDPSLMA